MPMKVAYAILAHDHPHNVARLTRHLLDAAGTVAIHVDLKAGDGAQAAIAEALGARAQEIIWAERVSVGWGQWSMIEATFSAVQAILRSGTEPDYIHLMSGADYPIRPVSEFVAFLERHRGTEFIQSHSANLHKWVIDGLTKERYQYRHYFNFKRHPRLFVMNWKLQRLLGLRRKLPRGLTLHMGSQWCTLTPSTWSRIIELARSPDIARVFRTSWIPDEMLLQTLLASLDVRHSNRNLTHYQFTDYGVPVVYCNGHTSHLLKQPFFFARKISPHAARLRDDLDRVVSGEVEAVPFKDHEIGTPTKDYETFKERTRKTVAGKRTPSHVKDAWYGDLEWNLRPYVVLRGASAEELESIAAELDRLPGVTGHGRLFARQHIGFAGGRSRMAGYGRDDTALRDHKPPTFLSDVINADPDGVCSFCLTWNDISPMTDIAIFDKRSHVVLVKGDPLRAYAEETAKLRGSPAVSPPGLAVDGSPEEFQASARVFAEVHDRYVEKLERAQTRFIEIDLYSPRWRQNLAAFLGELVSTSDAEWRAFAARTATPALSDVATRLSNALELSRHLPGSTRRNRQMAQFLAGIPKPYLVIAGESAAELAAVSSALNRTGEFLISPVSHVNATAQPGSAGGGRPTPSAEHEIVLLRNAVARQDARVLGIELAGLPRSPLLDWVMYDSSAHVLHLKGSALRAISERLMPNVAVPRKSKMSFDPQVFEQAYREYQDALAAHRTSAVDGTAVTMTVDLAEPGWVARICAFLQGLSPAFDDKWATLLARRLDQAELALAELPDPAAAYSNARYLKVRMNQLDKSFAERNDRVMAMARITEFLRREMHQRRIRTTVIHEEKREKRS
jgi:hypothetical protein